MRTKIDGEEKGEANNRPANGVIVKSGEEEEEEE